ncbi:PREDICTED: UDP-glucuronosyltransferase 2C1-like, partial [Nicrophorus vespilloides]|uniref:UDP-glucuronosyltransferase 2C1-like n=1 Tax=Nicrophorus vespilloides TaxID=110193 RepID=A0ABM1MPX1_NICVS
MCLTWFLLLFTANNVFAARILGVFPIASYSHQIVYRPIWRELATRGHDLVVITTDPIDEPNLPNLKQIDLKYVYQFLKEKYNFTNIMSSWNVVNKLYVTSKRILDTSEVHLSHPEVQAIIKNETEHFDLLLIEFMDSTMFAFKHRFNCSVIGLTSMDAINMAHEAVGNPTHPILYPELTFPFGRNLNFFQRIMAIFYTGFMKIILYFYIPLASVLVDKYFGKGYPDLYELGQATDMLFINVNPIIHGIRPLSPATITIGGGIHLNPPKPLPRDIQTFLDNAKTGAIYFSLGSNIKSNAISLQTKQILLEAFKNMPQYQILWKFEDTELEGKPENVNIVQWAPQQDILRHPNIKLFITQGGLQSLDETIHNGVPFIGMPFFADQIFNILNAQEKELCAYLQHDQITVDKFKNTVVEVITNPKYKNNIIKWNKLIKDEPMSSLEKAIWWTEFVLRNKGAQHLKGPEHTIPLYQYYYLDVISFLIFLSHPEVQALIKNETEHFDLLMIEFMQPSMLAFKHRFNCPTIGLSSLDAVLWGHEATGNPTHPILYPDFSLPFSRNLHFFQRIFAVLFAGFMNYFGHYIYIPMETEVVEKYFGKGYPNLYELGLTIDMMFINVNPVIHGIRPITPSTISIGGGIHINPPKPLPNNIQIFLDNAKTGAIYFSLGSNIKSKSLSLKTKQVLLEAFRNMPQYQILWKFEDTELEGKPENVKIVQWAPQQDILRHPNIKLFITQGGLQSLDETIHNRVPFIGMPFFGDQIFNVLNAEENGVGVFLEHDKITAEGFKNTVVDVITNPKYKNNIVKWAKLIKDEPMTGMEKAIWWTEFVLRNKETQHLKGPENTIPL